VPRLSIVVPSRNTRDLTLRCLDSIAAAAPAAEVVVVEDGGDAASDGTAEEIAVRHPRVAVIRSPAQLGFTRAANLGLARTRGEVLLLLNSDTEVDAAGVTALLDEFGSRPRLGVAGADLHYPDGAPQWSGGREPSLAWLFVLASGAAAPLSRLPLYRRLRPLGAPAGSSREVEWVTGAAMAIRRAAWEEAGPFDEGFRFYGQDLDLCSQLRRAGWEVALLPGFRVLHHHGATIGRETGARGGRQHPELLWTDLLHWARRQRGERWARHARRALMAGGALRLLTRRLAAVSVTAADRPAWEQDGEAYRRALHALKASRAGRDLPP
jgi:N-acetylglucosaminyl-diphospho-decaprenol L-rhamnosyltransferase